MRILVADGQHVRAGQGLIVVEAMKMQNEIRCSSASTIAKMLVKEGQTVAASEPPLVID